MKRLIQKQSGKDYQDLYHYTNLARLFNILKTGMIDISSTHNNISLTRNPNFAAEDRCIGTNMECRLTLDGSKLTENHEVKPFHDLDFLGPVDGTDPGSSENEEVINTPINNIGQYIKGITIYKNQVRMNLFNYEIDKYLTPDEFMYWREQDMTPELQEKMDKWKSKPGAVSPLGKWSKDNPIKDFTFDDAIKMIKSVWKGGLTIL